MEATIDISKLMRAKAEAGFLVGPPRIGYRAVRTPEGSRAVPDPDTAPLVARAFVEVACNGLSLRQVTRLLQGLGLVGRRGEPVSLPTVQRMLSDPYYTGEGTSVGAAIVPAPLFEEVKERIRARRTTRLG